MPRREEPGRRAVREPVVRARRPPPRLRWGPADIPPASAFDEGEQQDDRTVAALTAARVSGAKLRAALARGLAVTIETSGPGAVAGIAKTGGRRVAAGTTTVTAAGRTSLRLRFTKAAKRSLGRRRSARLAVTLTFKPADGAAQTRRAAVRLKR